MNAETTDKGDDKTQCPPALQHPDDQFPLPTISTLPSSSTLASPCRHSEDSLSLSDVEIAGLVHPPTPDMDGISYGHTRRRGSLMDGVAGGDKHKTGKKKSRRERQRNQSGIDEGDEHKYFSDDGHASDFSSRSTSEDVELDDMLSEDGADDEETGLTKEDIRKRRRRKRRRTRLNERIAGDATGTKEEESLADQSVLKRSLINALLIGLWYASLAWIMKAHANAGRGGTSFRFRFPL